MQEPRAVGPHQTQARTETEIKDAGGRTQRRVFGQPVAVVVHNRRAVQLRKVCAETPVKFMQHQLVHRWQNSVTISTRRKMESHCLTHLLR